MADVLNFDATTVAPSTGFTPVPNNDYRAMVVESAIKDTKKNNGGKYLQLDWQILDGEHKGRIIFDRINIVNPNPTAQKIGQEQLSAICHATGVLKLNSSAQLHNIPCLIKVRVVQDPGQDPQNEVKRYSPIAGSTAPSTAAPAATNAPAPVAANAPAWARAKVS